MGLNICDFTCLCVGGGVLGSVATIESGTTYYTTVYNYDSTVDGVNTFRFTCIVCILNQILISFIWAD